MKFILQIFISFLLLFISCRQEIVPPDNPAGNINKPQLTRTNFTYTFSINANKITKKIVDYTYLNTFKSRIYAVINDHSSGSVEIIIKADQNNVLYSAVFDNDTNGTFTKIEGQQPKVIIINLNDFTGKLKVTLTDLE